MTLNVKDMIAAAEAEIVTLDASIASDRHGAKGVRFIDLRDRRELEREGRIPGAFHCPRGMLEFWIDPASPYHKPIFAEDVQFVFYCASGWRSALSAKTAQDMGLKKVSHLGGGFSAWRDAGLPIEDVAAK
ncbi:rhodanese-like domain-containing protein [Puniceibacterium sediminis]|uniref:Rhodanese-related sulfurtransferase n=1 Tax=Puniceibacterium sediminis TaxID=1608407 RepID=A0A238X8I8_9RHOB|nr:rhodanese-like domain-containing protein [Puniceibacterium sediminis]SNR54932.1 Rhodanese-related sulfurtransferase [Puniceibacterium sediminis]